MPKRLAQDRLPLHRVRPRQSSADCDILSGGQNPHGRGHFLPRTYASSGRNRCRYRSTEVVACLSLAEALPSSPSSWVSDGERSGMATWDRNPSRQVALTALCHVLECENHEPAHFGYRIFIRRTVATAASSPEGRRKEYFPTYWGSLPLWRAFTRCRPTCHRALMCSQRRYRAKTEDAWSA